ncbi:angiopoietin-related protein 4-like [Myripristis murdjan]|uniref:Angiopoietin-related protein 4-like n=1 Tax=Myripristis murdjan TaxID=586833 RepID=A0A667YKK6_9TELE|nr:angiopoietin-related protein 4-like [Myripristis murdjan]
MKTPLLLLVLVTVLVHVGSSFPTERRGSQGGRDKYSTWDDVNVVAHGLLQLGQALKEHVDKTKVQMRDVNTKLKAFNSTVAELQREQQEQGAALRARGQEAEERATLAAELAEEVRLKVEEMKSESRSIHSRMDQLEEKVDGALREPVAVESNYSDHSGASLVQRLMEAQSRRIDDLVEKIKQQQDKLEKQSLHLQTLQSKVAQKRFKLYRRRDEETALSGQTLQSDAPTGLARDCHDLFAQGQRASGVYTIQPQDSAPFNVLCEMTSEGGWTVIQKRHDGSQNFNQLWEHYQRGFGSLNGEFWLGLENIHSISKQGQYTLQVEVSDWAGQEQSARYQFRLGGAEKKYTLHLEQDFSGVLERIVTTGASGLPFSTLDNDNDLSADVNCAKLLSGGWWFSSCGESNLNGKYPRGPRLLRKQQSRRQVMFWMTTGGHNTSLRSTVLKIRPVTVK